MVYLNQFIVFYKTKKNSNTYKIYNLKHSYFPTNSFFDNIKIQGESTKNS